MNGVNRIMRLMTSQSILVEVQERMSEMMEVKKAHPKQRINTEELIEKVPELRLALNKAADSCLLILRPAVSDLDQTND